MPFAHDETACSRRGRLARAAAGVVAAAGLLLCAACNAWEWTYPVETSVDADLLLAEGQARLHEGEFGKAAEMFGRVLTLRSNASEALYGIVLARLRAHCGGQSPYEAFPVFFTAPAAGGGAPWAGYGVAELGALSRDLFDAAARAASLAGPGTDGVVGTNDAAFLADGAVVLALAASLRILDGDRDGAAGGAGDGLGLAGGFAVSVPGGLTSAARTNARAAVAAASNETRLAAVLRDRLGLVAYQYARPGTPLGVLGTVLVAMSSNLARAATNTGLLP